MRGADGSGLRRHAVFGEAGGFEGVGVAGNGRADDGVVRKGRHRGGRVCMASRSTERAHAVWAEAQTGGAGPGLKATSVAGRGIVASGKVAPLQLKPGKSASHPTRGRDRGSVRRQDRPALVLPGGRGDGDLEAAGVDRSVTGRGTTMDERLRARAATRGGDGSCVRRCVRTARREPARGGADRSTRRGVLAMAAGGAAVGCRPWRPRRRRMRRAATPSSWDRRSTRSAPQTGLAVSGHHRRIRHRRHRQRAQPGVAGRRAGVCLDMRRTRTFAPASSAFIELRCRRLRLPSSALNNEIWRGRRFCADSSANGVCGRGRKPAEMAWS